MSAGGWVHYPSDSLSGFESGKSRTVICGSNWLNKKRIGVTATCS